jgi:hypothetical protein
MEKKYGIKFTLLLTTVFLILFAGKCGDGAAPTTTPATTPTTTPTTTYNLRDRGPAGGWVFYDKGSYSDGWQYMEAWNADESGGAYDWKDSDTSTPGTSTAIGTGYNNTYNCMTGAEHPAAEDVSIAEHGGKTDWFLPSKDELNKMWVNLWSDGPDDNGVSNYTKVGSFGDYYYWSSSEFDDAKAYAQSFSNGLDVNYDKQAPGIRVRAVRRF